MEELKQDKYYCDYRGNGYGPFDTEEEAEKACRLKMKAPYTIAYISKGNAVTVGKQLHRDSDLLDTKIIYLK